MLPQLRTVGEAGPEAIIPLDRIGDVTRMLAPHNPSIANRIEPNGGRDVPPDIRVLFNGDIIDPRVFRNSDEEILTVVVNGYEYHADLRQRTVRTVQEQGGGL